MGTIIVYALVILWLVAMVPAVVVPFFMSRPNQSASRTLHSTTVPFRPNAHVGGDHQAPIDRNAA